VPQIVGGAKVYSSSEQHDAQAETAPTCGEKREVRMQRVGERQDGHRGQQKRQLSLCIE
jgi:hypothetical protein